jgi:hypothetical protein
MGAGAKAPPAFAFSLFYQWLSSSARHLNASRAKGVGTTPAKLPQAERDRHPLCWKLYADLCVEWKRSRSGLELLR